MNISIQNKMSYVDSAETRTYTLDNVSVEDSGANTIRAKVKAFNGYLARSVSTPVFVSPTGKSGKAVEETKIITVEETEIEGV